MKRLVVVVEEHEWEGGNALGSDDSKKDDIRSDGTNKDALHARIIWHHCLLSIFDNRSLQVVATCRLNLSRGGRNHLHHVCSANSPHTYMHGGAIRFRVGR